MANCEWCSKAFFQLAASQRFCCREHSDAFFAAERKQAVEYFRSQGMKPTTREVRDERRLSVFK